ncbi:hypothetical protein GPECTOR_70g519 [Gonium pectorale]|uniref:RNA polymerase sigma-70 domain-containing protein n=1 Tax=Gonium pectorale TaxID=33097 RepID=A0A150G371_GONPE|nr:hypothetical protein GPECTOR_70g519 [Gonium pectorale]|eukprot:KXZ44288.1 hypothetical protein GPECTOR_70g519 [Gonium pectorale]
MLNRLKGQASDLELLLDQLNSLEASLDDSVLAPPVRDDPGDLAARKAKRAAKRAERRAKATTAAVTGGSEVDHARPSATRTAAGPASSSGRSIRDAFKAVASPQVSPAPSAAVTSDVQQLEELFKLTVVEPELPPVEFRPAPRATPAPAAANSTTASVAPAVLKPRKVSRRVPAAAPLPPPPVAAPSPPPAAPAPAAPAPQSEAVSAPAAAGPVRRTSSTAVHVVSPAPAPEGLTQSLERLLGGPSRSAPEDEDAELDAHAGPSEDDLLALEREVASLAASLDDSDEDELTDVPGVGAVAAAGGATQLEASALVARAPAQVSVMPAGPSLLSLVPASATQGRSARSRQARRSARYGHSAHSARGSSVDSDGPRGKAQGKDGTTQFLQSSTSVSLLSADMEREVTEVCRDFIFLEKVKRQCQKTLHRKPAVEEVAAALGMDVRSYNMRYDAGLKAKEVLLKANYRLVMTVCKKFVNKGAQLQDLVSEGVKGLLRGVEMYDASKGFRFGTYAHWWIRQAVSRSLAETGRPVRLPNHMIEQLTKLKNASAKLSMDLNREPTMAELSAAVGLPTRRVELLLEAARSAASMETPMAGTETGATVKDTVQDEGPAADEAFGSSSMRADVEAMLEDLSEREATVLRLRFGLEDGVEWTLEDIGDKLGVTRERIRQVEAKALRKLQVKTVGDSGKLTDYSANMDMLESKDVAARVSNGTRKT